MKMPRWMNGTRVNVEVVPLEDKMKKKNRLRQFGHVYRRIEEVVKGPVVVPKQPLKKQEEDQRKLGQRMYDLKICNLTEEIAVNQT